MGWRRLICIQCSFLDLAKTSGAVVDAQHWGRCVLKAAHVLRKPSITGADAEGRKEWREKKEAGKGRRQPTLTSYTSVLALRTGASKCEDGEEYTSVALFSMSLHLPSGKLIIIHRYDIL